jgi:hypothetical protein
MWHTIWHTGRDEGGAIRGRIRSVQWPTVTGPASQVRSRAMMGYGGLQPDRRGDVELLTQYENAGLASGACMME